MSASVTFKSALLLPMAWVRPAYGLGAAVQFDQANGFSRNPEADRHFRAKRPKCEVLPEGVEQVATLLVAAIEAHLLANQAAAYTDQDLLV
jgi:hypothetical protein